MFSVMPIPAYLPRPPGLLPGDLSISHWGRENRGKNTGDISRSK